MCDGDRQPERSPYEMTAGEQEILDAVRTTGFTPGLSPEALAAWLAAQGREFGSRFGASSSPVGTVALHASFESAEARQS